MNYKNYKRIETFLPKTALIESVKIVDRIRGLTRVQHKKDLEVIYKYNNDKFRIYLSTHIAEKDIEKQ